MAGARTGMSSQFTQTDPLPLGTGSPFESAYMYGLGNPAVYVDPSGLRAAHGGYASELEQCQATAGQAWEKGWTAVINRSSGECQYIEGRIDQDCFSGNAFTAGFRCNQIRRAGITAFNDSVNPVAIAYNSGRMCGEAIQQHSAGKGLLGCGGAIVNAYAHAKLAGSTSQAGRATANTTRTVVIYFQSCPGADRPMVQPSLDSR